MDHAAQHHVQKRQTEYITSNTNKCAMAEMVIVMATDGYITNIT